MADALPSRSPRWYGIPVRVALVTFIGTLLSLAFGVLFGIIGLLIVWKLQGTHPDMAIAYRRFGVPGAFVGGVVILVLSLVTEIRQYRQSKALSSIERMG
jgi:hypothetical protein